MCELFAEQGRLLQMCNLLEFYLSSFLKGNFNYCCVIQLYSWYTYTKERVFFSTKMHIIGLNNRGSIVAGYGLNDRSLVSDWSRDFFLHHHILTGSGGHPASCPVGTRDSILGVNGWSVKLTTHVYLVPRMQWSYTSSTTPYILARCLIRYRNFNFLPCRCTENSECK